MLLLLQYPDHLSFTVGFRLLHRYTHEIANLEQVNNPTLALNAALMRTHLHSDYREGWKH